MDVVGEEVGDDVGGKVFEVAAVPLESELNVNGVLNCGIL